MVGRVSLQVYLPTCLPITYYLLPTACLLSKGAANSPRVSFIPKSVKLTSQAYLHQCRWFARFVYLLHRCPQTVTFTMNYATLVLAKNELVYILQNSIRPVYLVWALRYSTE